MRAGHDFVMWQLRKIIASWGLKIPKIGTGKKNRVLKKDLCNVLIERFMQSATDEEKAQVLQKMLGRKVATAEEKEQGAELVSAVAMLGASEGKAYQDIVDNCLNEVQRKTEKLRANAKPQEKQPDLEQEKTPMVKPDTSGEATSEPPTAHVKKASDVERAQPKVGYSKTPAPAELKQLLPDIGGLYLKWSTRDRRVTCEFLNLKGSGFQRTKTSSWPAYCGVLPKEQSMFTILKFIELTKKSHFPDSDSTWQMPSRERILECVTQLTERLAAEQNSGK